MIKRMTIIIGVRDKEIKNMTKQEIVKKIEELETDKFCEECKDRGLDWGYLYKLDAQIKELKALLNE